MKYLTIRENTGDTNDAMFERKIEFATQGLNLYCFNWLYGKVAKFSKQNAMTIVDYIMSMKSETNPSDYYRRDIIILLCKFSIFFNNQKSFNSFSRDDIILFLDSFRKPENYRSWGQWGVNQI